MSVGRPIQSQPSCRPSTYELGPAMERGGRRPRNVAHSLHSGNRSRICHDIKIQLTTEVPSIQGIGQIRVLCERQRRRSPEISIGEEVEAPIPFDTLMLIPCATFSAHETVNRSRQSNRATSCTPVTDVLAPPPPSVLTLSLLYNGLNAESGDRI